MLSFQGKLIMFFFFKVLASHLCCRVWGGLTRCVGAKERLGLLYFQRGWVLEVWEVGSGKWVGVCVWGGASC